MRARLYGGCGQSRIWPVWSSVGLTGHFLRKLPAPGQLIWLPGAGERLGSAAMSSTDCSYGIGPRRRRGHPAGAPPRPTRGPPSSPRSRPSPRRRRPRPPPVTIDPPARVNRPQSPAPASVDSWCGSPPRMNHQSPMRRTRPRDPISRPTNPALESSTIGIFSHSSFCSPGA